MTAEELLKASEDPNFCRFDSETEKCLWLARVQGWEAAHEIVESLPEPAASWIHAMLHRKEGDSWNADYWYARANKQSPAKGLSYEKEWETIVVALLS